MSNDQTITLRRSKLAAYQRAIELGKDEIARLRVDLTSIRAALEQSQRATDAERAARRAFEADAAQLRTAALACVQATSYDERFRARAELYVLASVEHPGVLLLREPEAARAVVAAAQAFCAAVASLDGIGRAEAELFAHVRNYDETTKGGT